MTELVRTSCDHLFCKACLVSHFEYCVTREFRFPPRCCKGPISLSDPVLQALSTEVIERFYAMQEELDTGVLERTYCHVPRCSTFIQPRYFTGDRATCPKCTAMTCVVCKEAHPDSDIWVCDRPQGLEVPGFREMVSGLGSACKQCPFCLQIVERISMCEDIRQWPRISGKKSVGSADSFPRMSLRCVLLLELSSTLVAGHSLQVPPGMERGEADVRKTGNDLLWLWLLG